MKIYIEDLKFQAVIGILDFEREKAQDIIVHVEIEYKYNNNFINYADISNYIEKDMKEREYLLIEDALESISKALHVEYPQIINLYIKITKPAIMPNSIVSVSLTS